MTRAMPLAEIKIDDHGIWVNHNMPCSVCHREKAIYQMNVGVFMPCDSCTAKGWQIRQFRPRSWWRRLFDVEAKALPGMTSRDDESKGVSHA